MTLSARPREPRRVSRNLQAAGFRVPAADLAEDRTSGGSASGKSRPSSVSKFAEGHNEAATVRENGER